jgi:glutamate/tyrosine decarboxylase-like PLP-dependent enzyme
MSTTDTIRRLELAARPLEPAAPERAVARDAVVGYAEEFLEAIGTMPAYVVTTDKGRGIYDAPIGEDPISVEEAIGLLRYNVDRPGLNPASGGHLGYIPGGGIYMSALGDYLADVMNRYAGVYFGSPGAVHLENVLLEWMANVLGYPAGYGGNLTSGGSIANLIGIVAARDAGLGGVAEVPRSVIYMTKQVHHCVDKAIRIAGLRECVIRHVPMDAHYRMDAPALDAMMERDARAGLRPWLVIASAGTTDTGAVDPLAEIAEIAASRGAWYHIDAAYGGFFVLCDEGRKILSGIGRSDSVVIDPHKGLFLPYGSGAVLVRERSRLYDAFWYQANYLQDALAGAEERSPADLSPELTKHFRGLRLWLPLKLHGLAPFRACVEEKLLLARYFHEQIQRIPGFEVGPYPDLSVVTYRYVPATGDANAFNERLVKEVHKDGRVFLSSTMLDGKFVLRLAVLSFRTHLHTIDLTLEVLREKAAMIALSI